MLNDQVKKASKPDILGIHPPAWNQSVVTREKICERKMRQLSAYDLPVYKYNYRAEVLPKTMTDYIPKSSKLQFDARTLSRGNHSESRPVSKRTEEMPVHPALATKPKWNLSTEVVPRERAGRAALDEERRSANTRTHNGTLKGYKTPVQIERARMTRLRQEKVDRAKGIVPASERRVEHKAPTVKTVFAKNPSRRYKKYYNDGVWEFSKIENAMVWSCSMNTDKDFRGSSHTVVNPDAFNFQGI